MRCQVGFRARRAFLFRCVIVFCSEVLDKKSTDYPGHAEAPDPDQGPEPRVGHATSTPPRGAKKDSPNQLQSKCPEELRPPSESSEIV